MTNFSLLADSIDTNCILSLLECNADLWDVHSFRKKPGLAHTQVQDIIIRFDEVGNYTQGITCINYPAYYTLGTAISDLLALVMSKVNAHTIGRCIITKLIPGKTVTPHADSEISINVYKRYHLCLYGATGNRFICGNETIEMKTGELWWFNNKITHSCVNSGESDRIHLIIDCI